MISVIVNLDSRHGVGDQVTTFTGHNDGARSWDFMTDGLENKRRFFAGFDHELIAYIDETVRVPDAILNRVRELSDCVVIRKHFTDYRDCRPFNLANDIRFLQALMMATGDTIAHFDADCAAFAREKSAVDGWLAHLETHKFVSYPSQWSPRPVDDPSFGPHTWASTRSFACRRETLRFDEIERGLREPEWMWQKYGEPLRKLNWMEHTLARLNEDSVIYPPRDDENMLIFCWSRYTAGTLATLNALPYGDVLNCIRIWGGIHYPNDVETP